jgi:hypothetical protein
MDIVLLKFVIASIWMWIITIIIYVTFHKSNDTLVFAWPQLKFSRYNIEYLNDNSVY